MKYYIDIDKSTPNWTYSLRLRKYPEQKIGSQVATFNSHVLAQNPGMAERIVAVLNSDLANS